jgi:hypothetical protein
VGQTGAAFVQGSGRQALQFLLHLHRGDHGVRAVRKDGHQAVTQGLDQLPAAGGMQRTSGRINSETTELAWALPSASYRAVLPRKSANRTVLRLMVAMCRAV